LWLCLLTAGATAEAKTYSAERYDSRIRVLADGSLEIVETVVFRFEDGSFTYVYREIPTRRTDAIEIVSADMDGRRLPFGTDAGEVEVRRRAPVHVRWHFAPRSGTSHTFVLTYIVRGVVRKSAGGDVLEWVALPTKHDYRIDSSEVVLESSVPFNSAPLVESRRVDNSSVEPGRERVQVLGRGIRKDGWIKARLQWTDSSVIAAAPAWQQRQLAATALGPRWMTAALAIFGTGLILFFGLRQGYDSPPRSIGASSQGADSPPDDLRPALAGAVASNGRVHMQHAMSTLFLLADRGAVSITEEPKRWGHRQFMLHRGGTGAASAPEEQVLLSAAFHQKKRDVETVTLDKARTSVASQMRGFRKAVQAELRNQGLWSDDRAAVRSRYLTVSFVLLFLALAGVIPAIVLSDRFEGWALLPAAAVGTLSIIGFIIYGALTPLSNEGVKRSEAWLSYQKHLKNVAREKAQLVRESPSRLLPFAVALGLAGAWSKFFKHHPGDLPPWFRTIDQDHRAFPAFIAAGGAGEGGGAGGGVGAGGAAGGGGSGAG
jgi:uncharacterized membrane protein YgcG